MTDKPLASSGRDVALYSNFAHILTHMVTVLYATAVLHLPTEFGMSYGEMLGFASLGLILYGVAALPAGWLGDRWSQVGMIVVFFVGVGLATIAVGMAQTSTQLYLGLSLIGLFAAIYHPVGLAMVVEGREKTGVPLAVNGIFGNMGVASAALLTGILLDFSGWRSAFYMPGLFSIGIGLLYWHFSYFTLNKHPLNSTAAKQQKSNSTVLPKALLKRIFIIILWVSAFGGLIFQSTTFALPKIFEERISDIAGTTTLIGFYTFLVFAIAAFAQLVVGYFLDHYPLRRIFSWITFLQCILFVAMTELSGIPALLGAIAFMLLVFGEIPITDVLIGRVVKNEWRSRAYALTYLINFSVSAAAIHLVANIHSHLGFDRLFILLAVFALLMFTAVLFLPQLTAPNRG